MQINSVNVVPTSASLLGASAAAPSPTMSCKSVRVGQCEEVPASKSSVSTRHDASCDSESVPACLIDVCEAFGSQPATGMCTSSSTASSSQLGGGDPQGERLPRSILGGRRPYFGEQSCFGGVAAYSMDLSCTRLGIGTEAQGGIWHSLVSRGSSL